MHQPFSVIKMCFYQQAVILQRIIFHRIYFVQCHFSFHQVVKKRKIKLAMPSAGSHFRNHLHQRVIHFFYTVAQYIIGSSIIIELLRVAMAGSRDKAVGKRKIGLLWQCSQQRGKYLVRIKDAVFSYKNIF